MSTSNLNKIDARMQQKHDIAENWKNSDLIPEAGEYIIYDPDEYTSFPRIKIGDGDHTVNELCFVSEIYTQPNEPEGAEDGAIWIDPEESKATPFTNVRMLKASNIESLDFSQYKAGDVVLVVLSGGQTYGN